MFNHSAIIDCLRGLVGFESNYRMNQEQVDTDLQQSDSGVYINSLHPLLNYDNLLATAEQFNTAAVKEWINTVPYKKEDLVQKDFRVYYSLVDDNTGNALTDDSKWRETTLLSAFLRRTYSASVVKLFNQLFVEKKLNEVAKSLLGQISLFEGVGNITGRITKTGRMVGYKLTVKHPDTVAKLSHIGLQLDTAQADVKLYLYHTSSNQPIKIFTLNHTRSIQFQWHVVEQQVLSYVSADINAGGSYYLTYYEDELTGAAIKKEYSFSGRGTCGTCSENVVNSRLYNQWNRFVSVQPFYINADAVNEDRSLWDESREIEIDNTTWGINLQLSVQCDVSDLICRSKSILATALSQQLVVDLLNAMAFSLRDNQKKERVAGLAAVALDNQENGQYGEAKKLASNIKALSFDLSSMSDACLPCNSAGSTVKRKTIWG